MATLYYIVVGETETELSAAEGHGLRIIRKVGAVSTASWSCHAACDSAPVWPYGTAVTVTRKVDAGAAEILFQGYVIMAEGDGRAYSETMVYQAADAWWFFEHEIYKFSRKVMSPAGELSSVSYARVLLGQASDGERLTAAATVTAITSYAAAIGININAGTFDAPILPPWDEITDKTIAEIILRVLRWQPDAVAWIDHATTPPTLNVTRRANMTAASVALTDLDDCRVRSCPELVIPGCVVTFEASNSYGRVISEQFAGNPAALGCARMTIPLEYESGQRGPVQECKVVALGDTNTVAWWQQMFPWLPNDAILSDVLILPTPPEGFTNVLVSGQVTQWMQDELGLSAGEFTVSCKVETTVDGKTYSAKDLSRTFTLTDAQTRRYRGKSVPGWSETEPAGLAAAFYAAAGVLQYGGTIVAVEEECSIGRTLIGKKVNVTGGLAAWATMGAVVIEVTEDFDTGSTTVVLGPQSTLTPQDMIDLIRCSRLRAKWSPLTPLDGGAASEDTAVVDPFAPETTDSESPGQLAGLNIVFEEPA